jgi:hypothetical protein
MHRPASRHVSCLGVERTWVSLYYPDPPVLYASTTSTNYLQGEDACLEEPRDNPEQNERKRSEEVTLRTTRAYKE